MTKLRKMRNEKGFTLVELAIVLVIIGIILAGIIKGQEMINNAKIKRVVSGQKEIAAAIYTYYDRYGKYPGDDNTAAARGGVWVGAVDGNGDGQIGGTAVTMFTCAAGTGGGVEACALWDHLRRANLIMGATGDSTNPQNAYGGRIGVAYFALGTGVPTTVNWIGLSSIPADVGQIIDTQNDDTNWQTGSIRGSAVYTGAASINLDFKL
ncbi:MAG: prepilin-type N-terminal cleavage/methylation domain-containing protein [Deltaproteobacteria bacterium]|nr:prepilin-type N-terminal cleavage/methylation domain-containing protein [Deltaproteobacteria bacterium]